jgi:hypothetical protein
MSVDAGKGIVMPVRYRIDEARQRIYTRAEGVVSYEELRTHIYSEAGELAASYGELFDCSGATINITSEEIQRLASARRAIGQRQPPGPLAVVATDPSFIAMLRRYYRLTEQVRPLRVFGDVREAESWLKEFTSR